MRVQCEREKKKLIEITRDWMDRGNSFCRVYMQPFTEAMERAIEISAKKNSIPYEDSGQGMVFGFGCKTRGRESLVDYIGSEIERVGDFYKEDNGKGFLKKTNDELEDVETMLRCIRYGPSSVSLVANVKNAADDNSYR